MCTKIEKKVKGPKIGFKVVILDSNLDANGNPTGESRLKSQFEFTSHFWTLGLNVAKFKHLYLN